MARKNAPLARSRPTRERVDQHIQLREWTAAYSAARLLHEVEPTAEHLSLLKRVIQQAASALIDGAKTTEFNRLMSEAAAIDFSNPQWSVEQACLLARGGRLADALMRVDESDRIRILGHGVDRALQANSKDYLPDELNAGFDSIVAAFAYYERGEDEAARAILEPIGLRSPFLEWKVLLRGLLAHAANDDARAIENFARLNPERLPWRLAEPYRAKLDQTYLPREPLHQRYENLNSIGVAESLREVARHLGRERPLKAALRAAGSAAALLKASAPHLVPKLSACLQQAIIRQGEPEDLAAFRKLFSPPADDPSFFKLQGRIAEEIGQNDVAARNWRAYEAWLAAKPTGWPDGLRDRVRAHIWHHVGSLLDTEAGTADPVVEACYRKAVELAPDWDAAALDLFAMLTLQKRHEEAESVARALLLHKPDSLEGVLGLANSLRLRNRHEDALECFRRALAINPLDSAMSIEAALAVVACARHRLFSGRAGEAQALMADAPEVRQPSFSSQVNALLAVIAMKLGDRDAVERHMNLQDVRQQLADWFRMSVDTQLAKVKPVERKAAATAFAETLAKPVGPLALANLLLAWEQYHRDGFTYRGQKTQEKKFVDLVLNTLSTTAPEREFELLGAHLANSKHEKIARRYLDRCIVRFPKNPHFLVLQAELGLETEVPNWTIESWLTRAKELAEKSRDERDRALVPRINELLRQVPNPYSFLDAFFNGRR